MKKLLLFTTFLITTVFLNGQTRDLANIASGTLVSSNILYDSKEDVYGYFYLYDQDKIDKETSQMEYVFLDKNLNKVSNGTFTVKEYERVRNFSYRCSVMDEDHILLRRTRYQVGLPYNFYTFQIISLKNKTVSPEYHYANGVINEVPQTSKEYKAYMRNIKRVKPSYEGYPFAYGRDKGFFIIETDNNSKTSNNRYLKFFNYNKELQWSYEYNPNAKRNKYKSIAINDITKNNIYITEYFVNKKNVSEVKYVALNPKTGEKKYEYVFENTKSLYSHILNTKEVNNQFVITGNYSAYNKKEGFSLDKNLGFFKIVLDEKGNEISKKYTLWEDYKTQIDVDKKGKAEKNYRLRPVQYFMLKDGTICMLTEKYKPYKKGIGDLVPIPIVNVLVEAATTQREKTTDFVLFFMDKDFNLKKVKTIEKELTKDYNYDYQFSQYIKDDAGVVFFFKDYSDKDKKWTLGISTILNGDMKEERIPISSKFKDEKEEYVILPMRAKEGYILLREYNKKEKYDQIRLEKVNY
ncbi:MAG: hypothetical protein LBP34_08130 [Flavobacteriaceae bacterium]|jgi:hypothetical protein|nr:hypothetical protein [Flavobacteriaceae bacterium]